MLQTERMVFWGNLIVVSIEDDVLSKNELGIEWREAELLWEITGHPQGSHSVLSNHSLLRYILCWFLHILKGFFYFVWKFTSNMQ